MRRPFLILATSQLLIYGHMSFTDPSGSLSLVPPALHLWLLFLNENGLHISLSTHPSDFSASDRTPPILFQFCPSFPTFLAHLLFGIHQPTASGRLCLFIFVRQSNPIRWYLKHFVHGRRRFCTPLPWLCALRDGIFHTISFVLIFCCHSDTAGLSSALGALSGVSSSGLSRDAHYVPITICLCYETERPREHSRHYTRV